MEINMKKYFTNINFNFVKSSNPLFKEVKVTFSYEKKTIGYFIFLKKGKYSDKYYLNEAKKIFDQDCKTLAMKRYVNRYIDATKGYPHRKLAIASIVLVALLAAGGGVLGWKLLSNNPSVPEAGSDVQCTGDHCLINGEADFKEKIKEGEVVNLTLTTDDENYMLPTLPEVTFGDRKAIYEEEYTYDFSTGKITFIMPEVEVKITASAIPPETEMTYVYDENKTKVGFYAYSTSGEKVEVDWGNGEGWKSSDQTHDYKNDGAKTGDIFNIKIRNATGLSLCEGTTKLYEEGDYAITEIKPGNKMKSLSQIGLYEGREKTSLEKIILPNSLTSINPKTLQYCNKIKSIAIPDSLANNGFVSFCANCTGLIDVVLPKDMQEISNEMFGWCSNLKYINFPAELKIIGDDSFIACEKLEKIVLPGKLEKIIGETFASCKSLKTIDLTAFTDITKLPTAGNATFAGINEEAKFYVNTTEIRDKFIELGKSVSATSWPTNPEKYIVVNQ